LNAATLLSNRPKKTLPLFLGAIGRASADPANDPFLAKPGEASNTFKLAYFVALETGSGGISAICNQASICHDHNHAWHSRLFSKHNDVSLYESGIVPSTFARCGSCPRIELDRTAKSIPKPSESTTVQQTTSHTSPIKRPRITVQFHHL
jgi:hypothetical protein